MYTSPLHCLHCPKHNLFHNSRAVARSPRTSDRAEDDGDTEGPRKSIGLGSSRGESWQLPARPKSCRPEKHSFVTSYFDPNINELRSKEEKNKKKNNVTKRI